MILFKNKSPIFYDTIYYYSQKLIPIKYKHSKFNSHIEELCIYFVPIVYMAFV